MGAELHGVPVQHGFVAEAIAAKFLGEDAKWLGGRNPGHDLVLGGIKIDVKSGVRQRNQLSLGADKQECIGIHLAKGVEGLPHQDVDELMIVVRDEYSDSGFNVSLDGDNALVEVAVNVHGVAVYRLSKEDVSRLFKRPFKRDGSQRASIQNVDAPVEDLQRFLVAAPATDGGSGS